MLDNDEDDEIAGDNPLQLAARLREAIGSIPKTEIAAICGVTDQAVTGWLKTGRVKKGNVARIASRTGRDLHWLLTGEKSLKAAPSPTANPAEQAAAASGVDSRIAKLLARATPKSRGALERIAAAAAAGKLTEADLELLEQIAKRFEAK